MKKLFSKIKKIKYIETEHEVKPNYVCRSEFLRIIGITLLILGILNTLLFFLNIISLESVILTLISTLIFLIQIITAEDYSFVKTFIINSMNIDEWAYNNGVAVMRYRDIMMIFKSPTLYLCPLRNCSISEQILPVGQKVKLRILTYTNLMTTYLNLSKPKKLKVEVLSGVIEGPSIKSCGDIMFISGVFLKVRFGFKLMFYFNKEWFNEFIRSINDLIMKL